MGQIFSLRKIHNILIETSPRGPSNDPCFNGATRYGIYEATGLSGEVLNRYLVRLYNSKLVAEDGDRLVTTQKGLEYLQKFHELQVMSTASKNNHISRDV